MREEGKKGLEGFANRQPIQREGDYGMQVVEHRSEFDAKCPPVKMVGALLSRAGTPHCGCTQWDRKAALLHDSQHSSFVSLNAMPTNLRINTATMGYIGIIRLHSMRSQGSLVLLSIALCNANKFRHQHCNLIHDGLQWNDAALATDGLR